MIDTVKVAISAVIGGVVTGIFGVWLQRVKNQGSNEGVYAEHTQDLFRRIDKLTTDLEKRTQERDGLKEQVLSLKGQVEKLNGVIDSLNEQIGNLTTKLEDFTRDGKEEK